MMQRWRYLTMLGTGLLLLCLSAVCAQDIPAAGQPPSDFYNACGTRLRVQWELDRTTVPEDEELVAKLVITGATNPREIIRPDLRKLPQFESRFIVVETQDPPPAADAPVVRFTYRLRPRNRSVDRLPTLAFHYYNFAAAEDKQFPLTTAREVRIGVTAPRPRPEPPAIPLAEPRWLLDYTPQPVSLSRTSYPVWWSWIAIGLAGPLVALVWYLAWRRIYPDATRLARMRRSRAARRATDAIRRAARAPDPPGAIAVAVLDYLHTRFLIDPTAVTPSELEAALVSLGLPPSECQAVAGFFRSCDAARFAPQGWGESTLAADAAALVTRLEAP